MDMPCIPLFSHVKKLTKIHVKIPNVNHLIENMLIKPNPISGSYIGMAVKNNQKGIHVTRSLVFGLQFPIYTAGFPFVLK